MGYKITRKKVIEAIKDSFGNQSVIARRCGVVRSTITMFLNKPKNSDVREMIETEREKQIDIAELGLTTKISEGNLPAIMFFLKTQGKKRGYVEKQEFDTQVLNVDVDVQTEEKLKELLQRVRDGVGK